MAPNGVERWLHLEFMGIVSGWDYKFLLQPPPLDLDDQSSIGSSWVKVKGVEPDVQSVAASSASDSWSKASSHSWEKVKAVVETDAQSVAASSAGSEAWSRLTSLDGHASLKADIGAKKDAADDSLEYV